MVSIDDFKKLKKDEMVKKYKELAAEYEVLEQQYNDLDDCYGELERDIENKENQADEKNEDNSLGELLQELKFNTELQDKIQNELFKEYKQSFIDNLKFYSVDIPEHIYDLNRPTINGINEKIYRMFEDYAEEALRFKV